MTSAARSRVPAIPTDWPRTSAIKIERCAINHRIGRNPISVKKAAVAGLRTYYDTALAVKSAEEVIVVDGMQGGHGADEGVHRARRHSTLPRCGQAVEAW